MRASPVLTLGLFVRLFFAASFAYPQTSEQPWIESGADKAAIARHSKSPDGRNALAWVVAGDQGAIDWSLLKTDPDGFYEKYEVRELWVVDLTQKKKLCSLGSSVGYVRPGSHRTLNVAWGPLEAGRRFAIVAYDWKWGTDALIVLDVGADNCRETQVGQIVDRSVNAFLMKGKGHAEKYDTRYSVGGLPALGLKTGFANASTVRIPFTAKIHERDEPVAQGIVALNLARRTDAPSATVSKIVVGSPGEDPFSDDTRLAKADRELNALYRDLLRRLAPADQESLQNEERAWIEQREKQAADVKPDYYENNRIVRDKTLQRLTEERIAELRKRAAVGKK
jgi:lysozyme inhibitor LprI